MIITINDQEVIVNQAQHDALTHIMNANVSGFACMHNYYPKSSWDVSPQQQLTFRAGGDQLKLDMRTLKELRLVTFNKIDTSSWEASKGKESFDNAKDQFDFCLNAMITKLEDKMKIQAEGRYNLASGALNQHQIGKLKNNIPVAKGVVANLVNTVDGEKNLDENGHQIFVLDGEGRPTVESIVFTYVYSQTKTLTEGVRKKGPNSGSKVQMNNLIEKVLPKNLGIRSCTLKDGAYLAIANDVIVNGLLEQEEKDILKYNEA